MLVVRGKVKYEKGVLDTSCVIKNRLCMTRWFWFLILFLFLFVTWSAFVSFVIHDVSVYSWMLAMKYDVFPLLVFVSIFLAWKVW